MNIQGMHKDTGQKFAKLDRFKIIPHYPHQDNEQCKRYGPNIDALFLAHLI